MKPYRKTKKMRLIEEKFDMPIHEMLRYMRVDKNMSLEKISKILEIERRTLMVYLDRMGIYSKKLVFYDKYGKEVKP